MLVIGSVYFRSVLEREKEEKDFGVGMAGGTRGFETTRPALDPNDKTIINQIMLKFRPIAPRPVTAGRSDGLLPLKEKRSKRKYVSLKKKITERCNGSEFVVTDLTVTENRRPVVESWITMESVTGTCEDHVSVEEIWKDLEMDNYPGFISNGYDEVEWVNLAYRRMVDLNPEGGVKAPPPEVMVRLGVKMEKIAMVENLPPAFSCRVRVVYQLLEKKKQMTVPCDVWKMDCGGYAWRLDVKAALSLGRLN